ncbi:DUF839 domain-containing protein [Halogeometricum borinquense]|uniref:DUF839 domain-containing protein n=1 Tax=Halogeometricum borinquense TaxID=60847 RepID=A0A6C0UIS5_9EURY|nr:alkaline phosphatase PhoX [Halogeometricum borinquense]QIB74201.1 DUF839 domain-containing protein [Halogeometricum borinquense]QIQ76594.1 DUF839 domain-containing protein [Halogeometricum borinquense]
MVEFTRRKLMATSVAAALGASVAGTAAAEDGDTPHAPMVKGELTRFATTAFGAEVTGPFVTQSGTLIFSLQHPSRQNPAPFNTGGIGYVKGFSFGDGDVQEIGIPNTKEKQSKVRVGNGEYVLLAREGDNIGDDEDLGIPTTPDGVNISQFDGTRYSDFGYTPDMNQFVPTNEDGTKGVLFTNFEASPGNVTRMPIEQDEDGAWTADRENTTNLANTEAMRELGGTRINCYGDRSPWGTPLSAEEEYAHPRLAGTATTSDIMDAGSGVGYRGASQFWNRPNPTEVGSSEWYDEYNDGVYPQGAFALAGLELHAYYLGADPVDDETPIGDTYPNVYRTGYIVDFRKPEWAEPKPVKYYVFGRAAWEAPDVQSDEKTVYLTSDGDTKGLYKFVADEPIPSYDDPMDVEGTLYAAKVTNEDAAKNKPPANVDLELDWLPLSHATNREVASWIAEYDDVTQVDYLETHAETDWQEDFEAALAEADKAVAKNGNQDFITDEEIQAWANKWTDDPNAVVDDESLRKVPFLETRAAAKAIGATVEFRKSEGIDSVEDAQPGDYIYLGISELNGGMSDQHGDLRMDRVDGGLVYRAEIEADYNISTLEPVIVGSDASDPADVANDSVLNIDNVFVMDDGRVLCCEDADKFGRSFPNDCMYLYTPDELGAIGDGDRNNGHGNDADGDDEGNPGNSE